MIIKKIQKADFNDWVSLGLLLWPRHSKPDLQREFKALFRSKRHQTFLCKEKNVNVGFVNVSLRKDFVPGSTSQGETDPPIGYLEGIFVKNDFRKLGIAKRLLRVAEQWAKRQGCRQMASDTEISNKGSQAFHQRTGFKEAGILMHFIKKL